MTDEDIKAAFDYIPDCKYEEGCRKILENKSNELKKFIDFHCIKCEKSTAFGECLFQAMRDDFVKKEAELEKKQNHAEQEELKYFALATRIIYNVAKNEALPPVTKFRQMMRNKRDFARKDSQSFTLWLRKKIRP